MIEWPEVETPEQERVAIRMRWMVVAIYAVTGVLLWWAFR